MAYTSSKAAAMRLLKATRARMIVSGRHAADDLIRARGVTNVDEVRHVMDTLGQIDWTVPLHWMGCIFHHKKYRKVAMPPIQSGVGHDKLSQHWTFS